jgi:hypothetical protein
VVKTLSNLVWGRLILWRIELMLSALGYFEELQVAHCWSLMRAGDLAGSSLSEELRI